MTRVSGEVLGPGKPAALLGQRVAFTGRFATLTRAEAEGLVAKAGGSAVAGVSARATMLVVGMRGWPLIDSGHVTQKLADAERLQASGRPIRILSEVAFREAVGLEAPAEAASKSLSGKQVCRALGIDARVLQRWEHCGLVRSRDGQYDFRDLVSLRTVTGLVARGVSAVVIRKSLDALGRSYRMWIGRWLSSTSLCLTPVSLLRSLRRPCLHRAVSSSFGSKGWARRQAMRLGRFRWSGLTRATARRG